MTDDFRVIQVPAHEIRVRVATPRVRDVACECFVASHCDKFGGCLAEYSPEDVTITRVGYHGTVPLSDSEPVGTERSATKHTPELPSTRDDAASTVSRDTDHVERVKALSSTTSNLILKETDQP